MPPFICFDFTTHKFFDKGHIHVFQKHQVLTEKFTTTILSVISNDPPCTGETSVNLNQPLQFHSYNKKSC